MVASGITIAVLLIVGLVFLIKGSDWFIRGVSQIASSFGISEFIIGLTLVAFGTSVPELASSIVAARAGSGSLVLGNIIGSNIANIALILGIATLIKPVRPEKALLQRDGHILLFITILFGLFLVFGAISIWESILLLLLYAGYLAFLFTDTDHLKQQHPFIQFVDYFVRFGYLKTAYKLIRSTNGESEKTVQIKHMIVPAGQTVIGLAGVILGARWFISGAIDISVLLGMSEGLVGTTIVAFGTSLPELLVTITAAYKGMTTLAVGNIIGSNIGNILLIGGVSGLITPLVGTGMWIAYGFMILTTVLLMFFARTQWKITRSEGAMLLTSYVVFIAVSVLM